MNQVIMTQPINHIIDADIKGFFDSVDHEWLMKFLGVRIGDQNFLRLIKRFLKNGYMEEGKLHPSYEGTPQGGVVSPILANVYLHYALDLWMEKVVKSECRGVVEIVRYADDFVICVQYKDEATKILTALKERLMKFKLELAEDKTRLIEFGRFADVNRQRRGEGKPETFAFLGFTHSCTRFSEKPGGIIRRQTIRKRLVAKLHEVKKELRKRRHQPIPVQGRWLGSVVQGFFNYHAVPTNFAALDQFRRESARHWFRSLRRRSQMARRRLNWKKFYPILDRWLPRARVSHPYPHVRFYRQHPRWEPYARNGPVRICPGGAG